MKFVGEYGISPESLYATGCLTPQMLEDQDYIPMQQFSPVVETLLNATGDPAAALKFGQCLGVSGLGALGFLIAASATLRQALDAVCALSPLFAGAAIVTPASTVDGGAGVQVMFAEECTASPVFQMEIAWALSATILRYVYPTVPGNVVWRFAHPEPRYSSAYQQVLGGVVQFDQPAYEVLFPKHTLECRLFTASAASLPVYIALCEAAIARTRQERGLVSNIALLLNTSDGMLPGMQEVAERLGLSVRSLHRKLQEAGTSFRELLDGSRRHRAAALLTGTRQPISDISDQLGFADVSSFRRTFSRWYGCPPSVFRVQHAETGDVTEATG
ncbi:MAG: AraC family transcriptional regulator ligand-binding domain-containing protein [Pseudomonadales bacterium]|nr:AraC family transcriptional regulator ligand-binding domain-containing protein [Pseudomonadales bacterium]